MENYKERLIIEYRELIKKRALLEKEVNSDEPRTMDSEQFNLLKQQLDYMYSYEGILFQRILLLMK